MTGSGLSEIDRRAIDACYEQALESFNEGGLPIGSALTRGNEIIAVGHNRRVQQGNPILHGEMDCLQNAGRQISYRDCTLYTSLSPCMMCAGTIVQFKIPRVVIGENRNFGGNEQFLRDHGVDVEIVDDLRCVDLMARFIAENGALWAEDIAD
ncbi:nucleoside deaminase [Novosphingobium mangrovi (ex Huang et al. 2023)]|uniref:Nucleoside deaminase n=1 Tax=Novosphingobium mangrovi (ex Huang et al. 2023) TaxID=2976432 RepID=A0ABT2I728_9SPHN|nr:nucleoside deaminase [Novosphingobium mangrovi (ex Huang et al. 2023)]MCT2400615.1 nucleoside deaminase [Novosphingobium mangrovi (ex Huang et al. 2023)]